MVTRKYAQYDVQNLLAIGIVSCIGGSKGGRQGRAPPLGVQILSFSCSFQQKFEK